MTTHSLLQEVVPLLCCPDDGGALTYRQNLCCERCRRIFPVLEDCIVDMLPSVPPSAEKDRFGAEYGEYYHRERNRAFVRSGEGRPWGTAEAITATQLRRKQKHVRLVVDAVSTAIGKSAGLVCDLTGGAGHYTLALAPKARTVLHCDLSLDSLLYTADLARRNGIANLLFFRVDYLRLPFSASLDCVLCLDTLIRGVAHENRLLQAIRRTVRPGGTAVVDFHNWWHNPVRRLGLMPENFRRNQSYGRSRAEQLMRSAGMRIHSYLPFYQEILEDGVLPGALRLVLPPTRHIFVAG